MFKKVEEFENKRKGAQLMRVIFVLKFSERNLKSWKKLLKKFNLRLTASLLVRKEIISR